MHFDFQELSKTHFKDLITVNLLYQVTFALSFLIEEGFVKIHNSILVKLICDHSKIQKYRKRKKDV